MFAFALWLWLIITCFIDYSIKFEDEVNPFHCRSNACNVPLEMAMFVIENGSTALRSSISFIAFPFIDSI